MFLSRAACKASVRTPKIRKIINTRACTHSHTMMLASVWFSASIPSISLVTIPHNKPIKKNQQNERGKKKKKEGQCVQSGLPRQNIHFKLDPLSPPFKMEGTFLLFSRNLPNLSNSLTVSSVIEAFTAVKQSATTNNKDKNFIVAFVITTKSRGQLDFSFFPPPVTYLLHKHYQTLRTESLRDLSQIIRFCWKIRNLADFKTRKTQFPAFFQPRKIALHLQLVKRSHTLRLRPHFNLLETQVHTKNATKENHLSKTRRINWYENSPFLPDALSSISSHLSI